MSESSAAAPVAASAAAATIAPVEEKSAAAAAAAAPAAAAEASSSALPETMLAARLHAPIDGSIREFTREDLEKKLLLERVPLPKPRNGQVLIKVAMSALLPMNMSELKAAYGKTTKAHEKGAVQCGSEGCGTVVSSGGGMLTWGLVGKRVAFFRYNAAWAEYACVSADQVMTLPDKVPFKSACAAFANPFTVLSFGEIAAAAGAKTIVHTAGASTLGIQLIKYMVRKNNNVIAVVRRDAQVVKCKEAGAVEAFNSTSPTFFEDLRAACEKYKAKIAFDAVAGELSGTVLAAMPDGSTMHVYGGLSEDRPVISTRDLIFKRKTVTGFWLKDYAASKYKVGLLGWSLTVPRNLLDIFSSPVSQTFRLEQLHDAVLAYSKDMSSGKIVLVCDKSLSLE